MNGLIINMTPYLSSRFNLTTTNPLETADLCEYPYIYSFYRNVTNVSLNFRKFIFSMHYCYFLNNSLGN